MGKCETEYGIEFDTNYADELRGELLEMPTTEISELFGSGEYPNITLVAFAQVSDGEVIDFGFEWGAGTGHELDFELDRNQIVAMPGSEFFELIDQHLHECISIFLAGAAEDNW